MHSAFLPNAPRFLFRKMLSSRVFPGVETSGSSDRYLTTIKNSYKQGKLLGRAQEGGEGGTYPSDPYHTFHSQIDFFFPRRREKEKKNHKSAAFTALKRGLRCFPRVEDKPFIQSVCLRAANAWMLNNHR